MRTIKFRGKGLISGELIYGDLIHGVGAKNGRVFILPCEVNLAYVKNCDPLDGVEVDPDTVGQFTGLPDKNGKEIYEGDICKRPSSNGTKDQMAIGTIVYHKSSFCLHHIDTNLRIGVDNLVYHYTDCEIIGNIHENPELLNPQQWQI